MASESGLFPAVLRYWRGRRGWSQLDLALEARVSARHISFLETGRAQPSREMVLRLGDTLGLSLRDRNAMLRAADFAHAFEEPSFEGGLPAPLAQAIDRMAEQHEPFPLAVMTRHFDLLRANAGASRLLGHLIADPSRLSSPPNVMRMLFDPELARGKVVDWDRVARGMLSRLHRELLARPNDQKLSALLSSLLAMPGIPEEWKEPDLASPSEPTLVVRFRHEGMSLAFLTTLTVFHAPQNVLLEDIIIESYFPFDEETKAACIALRDG